MLKILPQVEATLTITPLTTNNGYVTINMGQTEIIQDAKIILHIINTNEIRQTIEAIEDSTKNSQIHQDPTITTQIRTIKAKLSAIEPKGHSRFKRGLANFIGTAQKWLFGTMDEEDRQDIANHLKTVEENIDNSVGNLNKQIAINSNFNESINHLKNIIELDRNEITRAHKEIVGTEKRLIIQQLKTDQLLKIRILEEKLNHIIDSIALAKHGLVHPSMLTADEIEETQLDFYRLKNIKTGLLKYDNHTLILAIKIPNRYKLVDYKLITAIPNKNKLEVIIDDQLILEINKTKYEYNKLIQYEKDLKIVKNCIESRNCNLKENIVTEIKRIDENTIICKNVKDIVIENYCDDRKIKLEEHCLININNCSIKILNETYENKNLQFVERFYYNEDTNYNFTKPIDFKEILLKSNTNLKYIKNLKYHKNVQYIAGSTIMIIAIIIGISLKFGREHAKVKISIKDKETKSEKIQENFDLKGGMVTYLGTYPSIGNI